MKNAKLFSLLLSIFLSDFAYDSISFTQPQLTIITPCNYYEQLTNTMRSMMLPEISPKEIASDGRDKCLLSSLNSSTVSLDQVRFQILLVGEGNLSFAYSLIKKMSKSKVFQRYRSSVKNNGERRMSVKTSSKEEKHSSGSRTRISTRTKGGNSCAVLTEGYTTSLMPSSPALITREMYVFIYVTTFDPLSELVVKYPETKPLLEYFSTKTRLRIELLGNVNAVCLGETFLGATSFITTTANAYSAVKVPTDSSSTICREVPPPCRSPETLDNTSDNKKSGCKVNGAHPNDEPHSSSQSTCPYLIIFNNPHIGVEDFVRHYALLSHFFDSARSLIDLCRPAATNSSLALAPIPENAASLPMRKSTGSNSLLKHSKNLSYVSCSHFLFLTEVVVALCDDQPKRWNLFGAAKRAGFVCVAAVPLVSSEYPSYSNKRHQSDCGFPFQEMLQYYFLRMNDKNVSTSKWSAGSASKVLVHQQQYEDLIEEFSLTEANMLHNWHNYWGEKSFMSENQMKSSDSTENCRCGCRQDLSDLISSKPSEVIPCTKEKKGSRFGRRDARIGASGLTVLRLLPSANLMGTKHMIKNDVRATLEPQSFLPPFPVLHPSLAFYSSFCTTHNTCHRSDTRGCYPISVTKTDPLDSNESKAINSSIDGPPGTDTDPGCNSFSNVAPSLPASFMSLLKMEKREEHFSPYIPPSHLVQLLRLQLMIEREYHEEQELAAASLALKEPPIRCRSNNSTSKKNGLRESGTSTGRACSPYQSEACATSRASQELSPSPPPHLNPARLERALTELEKKKLRRFRLLYYKRKKKNYPDPTFSCDSVCNLFAQSQDSVDVFFKNSESESLRSYSRGNGTNYLSEDSEVARRVVNRIQEPSDNHVRLKAFDEIPGSPCPLPVLYDLCAGARNLLDTHSSCASTQKADAYNRERCEICGIVFPEDAYELHLENLSPAPSRSLIERLTCNCCDPPRRFVDERALKQHKSGKGKVDRPFGAKK